jgi:hypothetical protein
MSELEPTREEALSLLAETPPRQGRSLSGNELQRRAEEVRTVAAAMHHSRSREVMYYLAERYERIARRRKNNADAC